IGNEIQIDLNADVLFEFDKADLLPKAEETLKKAADVIRERGPKGAVRVEGHTDGKGDDNYNMKLSVRRAESVRNWLTQKGGLSGVNFTTKGFGRTQPVAPNTNPDGSDNPEGRQKNRRVTIVMSK
ncbi:MAG: OmpA family protein, partial [Thermoanaerobaculia bacterium]